MLFLGQTSAGCGGRSSRMVIVNTGIVIVGDGGDCVCSSADVDAGGALLDSCCICGQTVCTTLHLCGTA